MSDTTRPDKIIKSDSEWRSELAPDVYQVTRQHGTERPFTHPYNALKAAGIYKCAACEAPLFDSETKYDSGSGWPSFYRPIQNDAVTAYEDRSLNMRRIEVRCARCDSHLGHVFEDGPQPTGLRFCINGTALKHQPT